MSNEISVVVAGTSPAVYSHELRAKIRGMQDRMEAHVKKCPDSALTFVERHYFAKGVYAKELHIPKGVVVVGKLHFQSQINILSKGDISVLTENGMIRVTAPFTIVSPPGVKRVGYAHEDSIWTTIFGTDITDIDEIQDTLMCVNFEDYDKLLESSKQGDAAWQT